MAELFRKRFPMMSAIVVVVGIIISVIHISPPYLNTECVLFNKNCPIIKSNTTVHSFDSHINFSLIGKSINYWIKNGEEIASQINIRIGSKEVYSFYSGDTLKMNAAINISDESLFTIFSNTKTFTALLIGIAIDNKWIDSYNDPVTKYWKLFPTNNGKYSLKIADILRHEAGLCIFNDNYYVVYDRNNRNRNVTTYKSIKKIIQNQTIKYYNNNSRCYHTCSRGWILNQIFQNVEPKQRYMAQYYEDEILPVLLKNDPSFGLTFRGLKYVKYFNNKRIYNNMNSFDVVQPSLLWMFYHVTLPNMFKIATISDKTLNNIFCKYLDNKDLCLKQNMYINETLFKMSLDNIYEMHSKNNYQPIQLSQYNRDLAMEHMSSMGLANAHSMTKAYEYILNNLISKDTKRLMFSEIKENFDILLEINTKFTIGGFGYFNWAGVEWYGWSGWGGSTMLYAPKYECFLAYTVNGFKRMTYQGDPRKAAIINLIAKQLLKT